MKQIDIQTPEDLVKFLNIKLDKELEEKLMPQHTEIEFVPEESILEKLSKFNVDIERVKIESMIDNLYPNSDDIPERITSMLAHLSDDDDQYYQKWISILEHSLVFPLTEEMKIRDILSEWYYIEKLYYNDEVTKKTLYYSGWILNILLILKNTKLRHTHNINKRIEYYNEFILTIVLSKYEFMKHVSIQKMELLVPKPQTNLNLKLFLEEFIEYILYFMIPIQNSYYETVLDRFYGILKWTNMRKDNPELAKNFHILERHYYDSKYSFHYNDWLNCVEMFVSTSNKLINIPVFDFSVVFCKLNSYNKYFAKEYYKLLNTKKFLFGIFTIN